MHTEDRTVDQSVLEMETSEIVSDTDSILPEPHEISTRVSFSRRTENVPQQ